MVEMMISYLNKILGVLIDTRRLDVGVPPDYIKKMLALLRPFHQHRKSFTVKEMERITGMLVFIAGTAPWLKFLMPHVYTSVAVAIGDNTSHLRKTNKQFLQMLKEAKTPGPPTRTSTFAQAETARAVHSYPKKHWINRTLKEELHLITRALESRRLQLHTPIGHWPLDTP